jgi:hypothetical protein
MQFKLEIEEIVLDALKRRGEFRKWPNSKSAFIISLLSVKWVVINEWFRLNISAIPSQQSN